MVSPMKTGVQATKEVVSKHLKDLTPFEMLVSADVSSEAHIFFTFGKYRIWHCHRIWVISQLTFSKTTFFPNCRIIRLWFASFYTCSAWARFPKRPYGSLTIQYKTFRVPMRRLRLCSASGMIADENMDDFYAIMRQNTASMYYATDTGKRQCNPENDSRCDRSQTV